MAFHSDESKSPEANPASTRPSLPWWTWIAPFFIANLGTWLSLGFKTDPGASLWYLPTAFGIVMAYWWGPRALLGIYLNAVVCTPLWDLPWQWSFLYALPETIEVGLSWLFFTRFAKGKPWLPDLGNVGLFLLFGSLVPTLTANIYLVWQLFFLGNITRDSILNLWQVLFSADLATHLVFAVPALVIGTKYISERGWTQIKEKISQTPRLIERRISRPEFALIVGIFVSVPGLLLFFQIQNLWILYGFLMVFLAIRYGVYLAMLGVSWVGMFTFLLPVILAGKLGSSSAGFIDLLTINLNILLLAGVTLATGRAISDLSAEINERKQSEANLRKAEVQYRTLAERIPPIVYTSGVDQHIGVTYVSPRIAMLGFTQEEWIADPELWFRQIHPDDQKMILDAIEEIKISGNPFKAEYRIRSRDGKILWFLDEAVDIVDSNQKLLFRQGFMLDITARKQAEDDLLDQNAYLGLLNQMTRIVLLTNDYDATLRALAYDMKKIIDADDCYILRWDEENQIPIPITTTANLDFSFSETGIDKDETGITESVLRAGHAISVEDVTNSPHIDYAIARRFPAQSVLGIPLIAGGHKLGAVVIAFNSHHHFTQTEIDRAETAGSQVALALWEFQQSIEIQHRLKESNALTEIGRALSETERTGTGKVMQLIVDSALELIERAEESVIHLVDVDEQTLVPHAIAGFGTGTKTSETPRMRLGEGVAGLVIHSGETINVGNVHTSPLFLMQEVQPKFQSLLVAPVQSGDRQIGTISVQSGELNAFSFRDVELLNALGIQAAIAIENTRLFETTQQRLKEVNALYRTSQGLASSLNTDELIDDVVNLLQQNFGYYHTQIYLQDPESGDLLLKSGSGEIGAELLKQGFRLPKGMGVISHVVETAIPFFTNNVNDVVFFVRNPLLPNTQSELTVPIKVDGAVVGVLDIQHTPPRHLTDNDLQLMTAVADQLAVALQKANLYANLQAALKQEHTVRSQLIQSERLALVGQLLASVSHELNNPLQAIQNALFLLKDEESLSTQGQQDLDVILSETERMAALIERLRSAYRPTRINDFQSIEINSLIEDVHMLIATHMRNKTIAFEFHPDSQTPVISGFPDQIRQVTLNLFLNAIEAMKPGGRLVVTTRSLPLKNEILLTVKDTGPGIAADILPKIFDAFTTDKHTGTGLGLTITHDIIEQHHGRISAENDPEGGAIFRVWFPVIQRGQA